VVIEKDGIIATQNETIHHREDQINESDHIITQRDTVIEFLQTQVQDLILAVDDAQAQIEELQQPPKIPRRLKGSQNLILSTGILSSVPTIPLPEVSHQ
jgi:uncharacterized protein (DUF3084 family)